MQGYFFNQELKTKDLPESLSKYGLWNITPEVKFSQHRRGIETNCAEQADKKSMTLKMDYEFGFVNPIVKKLIGKNYGL